MALNYNPGAGGNQSTNSIQQANGPYIINVGIKQVVGQQTTDNFWNSISTNNNNTNISGTTIAAPYLTPLAYSSYNVYIPKNLYVGGTIYGTVVAPSDVRVKENIETLNSNLCGNIMNLDPKSYSYIHDEDHYQHFGFIAQEVEKELPSLIYEHNDPTTNTTIKAINYIEMIPLLLLKIKEQQKELDLIKEGNMCFLREINEIKNIVKQK